MGLVLVLVLVLVRVRPRLALDQTRHYQSLLRPSHSSVISPVTGLAAIVDLDSMVSSLSPISLEVFSSWFISLGSFGLFLRRPIA